MGCNLLECSVRLMCTKIVGFVFTTIRIDLLMITTLLLGCQPTTAKMLSNSSFAATSLFEIFATKLLEFLLCILSQGHLGRIFLPIQASFVTCSNMEAMYLSCMDRRHCIQLKSADKFLYFCVRFGCYCYVYWLQIDFVDFFVFSRYFLIQH